MKNSPMRSIILAASPVPTREVEGYPAWVDRERYDVTAKPPPEPPEARCGGSFGADVPEPITAIQEQLGLKFQPEKMRMPVFVVDSIERPSEN